MKLRQMFVLKDLLFFLLTTHPKQQQQHFGGAGEGLVELRSY